MLSTNRKNTKDNFESKKIILGLKIGPNNIKKFNKEQFKKIN